MDYSLAAFSVHGILQARILEWVAMQPMGRTLGDLPDRGIKLASLTSPAMVGGFFATGATWEAFTLVCITCFFSLLTTFPLHN